MEVQSGYNLDILQYPSSNKSRSFFPEAYAIQSVKEENNSRTIQLQENYWQEIEIVSMCDFKGEWISQLHCVT